MKMALERLEPCAMKVARTVLRRVVTGDSHDLSDTTGLQPPYAGLYNHLLGFIYETPELS
jgi:hypothetical protein